MFSTREVPWMTLGKLTEKPVSAAEAAEIAGMDFEVTKQPLFFKDDSDRFVAMDDRVAIVRKDTNTPLGVMAPTYQMLQYSEAFDFMDGAKSPYVAAGLLKGGKQGFMVVEAPKHFNALDAYDPHGLYMILRTSHDGSRAVEVTVQSLRHRCMNQLTLRSFAHGAPHRWSIRHTTTMRDKLAQAALSIKNVSAYAKDYEETAAKLVDMELTEERAIIALKDVLPDKPKREEQITRIITSWHTSETVGKTFDYTGWGLLNATSEFMEWGRNGSSAESRMIGALQGPIINTTNKLAERLFAFA